MAQLFENITYNHLNIFQVGKLGEYWVKIWLTLHGLDVYTTEVDDKGVDFVVRLNDEKHIDIQVKTIREKTTTVYENKETWKTGLRDNLYLVMVILRNNSSPEIYPIRSTEWLHPNTLLKDNNYSKEGQTSKPEWAVSLSKKNLNLLKQYNTERFLKEIGIM